MRVRLLTTKLSALGRCGRYGDLETTERFQSRTRYILTQGGGIEASSGARQASTTASGEKDQVREELDPRKKGGAVRKVRKRNNKARRRDGGGGGEDQHGQGSSCTGP
jgi:hypothetical protein